VFDEIGQQIKILPGPEHDDGGWKAQLPHGIERLSIVEGRYGKIQKDNIGLGAPEHGFQLINTIDQIQFENAPRQDLPQGLFLNGRTPAYKQPERLFGETHMRSMVIAIKRINPRT
jgi:hypothetical protein